MTLVTSTLDSVIVVWHVAVNAGDAESAAAACTEDVILVGPQGKAEGRDAMREWVSTAGVRLMPRDSYDIPNGIVVTQEVTWPRSADYDPQAAPERIYTSFGLRDGSIASVHRFSTLEEARAFSVAA